jgi:polysaccharide biosynthesis/export protein
MKLRQPLHQFVFIFLAAWLMSSCNINRDFILKTDEDYVYNTLPQDSAFKSVILVPNMILTFDLFTNDGALVLEYTTSDIERAQVNAVVKSQYVVQEDGFCEFPLIGMQQIAGLSLLDCEKKLEEAYSSQFVEPYVKINVLNRRVLVFRGQRGEGQAVGLTDVNASLIEVLSLAGGLAESADARKVRIFRMVDGKQEVYKIDLSKIEGMQQARIVMLHGDIVHVEPVPRIPREIQKDVLPVVQVISSLAIIYGVIGRLF